MKWLTTFILCLLAFQVTAQELPHMPEVQDPETQIVTLPMFVQCGPIPPDTMLEQNYNELGMLEGLGQMFIAPTKTLGGKMRMFVDPDDKSWTVMLEVGPDLHCMVMSGNDLGPMTRGTEL